MRKQLGFTLMEMMITIVILGILVGVAFPAYQGQMSSARRATAAGCLTEYAQYMERIFSANMTYVSNNGVPVTALPATNCSKDLTGLYGFSFGTPPTATTFILSAAPLGAQSSDACGALTIDQLGVRSANGATDAATISACW
jgi:type IV pilus assembly protein PilE